MFLLLGLRFEDVALHLVGRDVAAAHTAAAASRELELVVDERVHVFVQWARRRPSSVAVRRRSWGLVQALQTRRCSFGRFCKNLICVRTAR